MSAIEKLRSLFDEKDAPNAISYFENEIVPIIETLPSENQAEAHMIMALCCQKVGDWKKADAHAVFVISDLKEYDVEVNTDEPYMEMMLIVLNARLRTNRIFAAYVFARRNVREVFLKDIDLISCLRSIETSLANKLAWYLNCLVFFLMILLSVLHRVWGFLKPFEHIFILSLLVISSTIWFFYRKYWIGIIQSFIKIK